VEEILVDVPVILKVKERVELRERVGGQESLCGFNGILFELRAFNSFSPNSIHRDRHFFSHGEEPVPGSSIPSVSNSVLAVTEWKREDGSKSVGADFPSLPLCLSGTLNPTTTTD